MEKPKEYILCAAIWYKDLKPLSERTDNSYYLPRNINHGIVFSGWRHLQCLHQMVNLYGLRQCEAGEEVQGFLTSTNRFVTREKAAKIAKDRDQLIRYESVETLYSEDLY